MLWKLDVSNKAIKNLRAKVVQSLWKILNFAKKNQFIFWIILIFIYYLTRKEILFYRHKARRFEVNVVKDFIPLGVIKEPATKHILLWNPGTNDDDASQDLKSVNCNMKNCIFSRNRRLFHSLTDFDAIMFDVGSSNELDGLPGMRNKEQIYIMANEE